MAGSAGSDGMAGSAGAGGDGMAGSAGGTGMAGAAGDDSMGAANPRGDLPNGLEFPDELFDWRVIGAISRSDDDTVRVIVGNDTAVNAARTGQTNPWPDGSMIGHVVWAAGDNEAINSTLSEDALVPSGFRAVTLMVKDSDAYEDDGGWAYGVWGGEGLDATDDPDFDADCISCHTDNAADNDYVFTRVGALPSQATVETAVDAPNGIALPAGFLDWKVIGVIDRSEDAMDPSIRVVVGNDTAVDAARDGETNPWPDGSMIGHFVWAAGENESINTTLTGDAVVPGGFNLVTLMVRDGDLYEDDGGWAYGAWTGANLDPLGEGFDQACIDCHTDNVADNDYVFTIPGPLPQ
jgi:hypothetical protein